MEQSKRQATIIILNHDRLKVKSFSEAAFCDVINAILRSDPSVGVKIFITLSFVIIITLVYIGFIKFKLFQLVLSLKCRFNEIHRLNPHIVQDSSSEAAEQPRPTFPLNLIISLSLRFVTISTR